MRRLVVTGESGLIARRLVCAAIDVGCDNLVDGWLRRWIGTTCETDLEDVVRRAVGAHPGSGDVPLTA
jgi:hypothetical protein